MKIHELSPLRAPFQTLSAWAEVTARATARLPARVIRVRRRAPAAA